MNRFKVEVTKKTHTAFKPKGNINRPFSSMAVSSMPIPTPQPIIVSVEAAIASGKSTLLERLKKHFGQTVYIIPEPVELWQAIGGKQENNILRRFYDDQKRWSYAFQSYVFLTRVRAVEEAIAKLRAEGRLETTVIVVERSYYSDKETFGRMLRESGDLNDVEWEMYTTWWNILVAKAPKFTGHVYMRTSLDTVMKRLKIRNRGEEEGLPREYQEQLIAKHEEWVVQRQRKVPICIVDADKDFKSTPEEWDEVAFQLSQFFHRKCMPMLPSPARATLAEALLHRASAPERHGVSTSASRPRRVLQRHVTVVSSCADAVREQENAAAYLAAASQSQLKRRRALRVHMTC